MLPGVNAVTGYKEDEQLSDFDAGDVLIELFVYRICQSVIKINSAFFVQFCQEKDPAG